MIRYLPGCAGPPAQSRLEPANAPRASRRVTFSFIRESMPFGVRGKKGYRFFIHCRWMVGGGRPPGVMKGERARILWVGRDEAPALAGVLVESASSGAEGLARLRQCYYDAVLASFPLPDCGPEELLEEFKRAAPAVPFLVQDPAGKIADAVRLIKLGADYFFGGQVVAGGRGGGV